MGFPSCSDLFNVTQMRDLLWNDPLKADDLGSPWRRAEGCCYLASQVVVLVWIDEGRRTSQSMVLPGGLWQPAWGRLCWDLLCEAPLTNTITYHSRQMKDFLIKGCNKSFFLHELECLTSQFWAILYNQIFLYWALKEDFGIILWCRCFWCPRYS